MLKNVLRHSEEASVALSRLCDAFSRAAGMIFAMFLFKKYSVHENSKAFTNSFINDTLL